VPLTNIDILPETIRSGGSLRVVSTEGGNENRLVGGSETQGDDSRPYEPTMISFRLRVCILVW